LTWLGKQPFHRYVDRSLLGLAVAGLWPFLRSIGADSWAAVGLVKPTGHWHRLAGGFVLGFASLASVALLAIASGARALNGDISAAQLLKKFGSAGLAAGVVAFLEELLFVVALFGAFCNMHGSRP